MKKVFFGTLLLALVIIGPIPTMARVNIDINISLPPLIELATPPEVIVIPETNVYVDPEIDVNIFFCNGWWWRPWKGRWYRSRDYRSGWVHYPRTPSFYNGLPSGWRTAYKQHRYKGKEWNYERIPHEQLQQNWQTWGKTRYWEKKNNWGVKDLRSRTRSSQPSQMVQPQTQAKPQSRGVVESPRSRSNSGEIQQQPQSQHEKATQKANHKNEKSEKGNKDRQDRN